MAKSIKLTDNNYIDASGVYDNNLQKNQFQLNTINNYQRYVRCLNWSTGKTLTATLPTTSYATYLIIICCIYGTSSSNSSMYLYVPMGNGAMKIAGEDCTFSMNGNTLTITMTQQGYKLGTILPLSTYANTP